MSQSVKLRTNEAKMGPIQKTIKPISQGVMNRKAIRSSYRARRLILWPETPLLYSLAAAPASALTIITSL